MAEAKAKADMENKDDATAAKDKAEDLQKEVSTRIRLLSSCAYCFFGVQHVCRSCLQKCAFRGVPVATWQHSTP